jgi:hypothetical protein
MKLKTIELYTVSELLEIKPKLLGKIQNKLIDCYRLDYTIECDFDYLGIIAIVINTYYDEIYAIKIKHIDNINLLWYKLKKESKNYKFFNAHNKLIVNSFFKDSNYDGSYHEIIANKKGYAYLDNTDPKIELYGNIGYFLSHIIESINNEIKKETDYINSDKYLIELCNDNGYYFDIYGNIQD